MTPPSPQAIEAARAFWYSTVPTNELDAELARALDAFALAAIAAEREACARVVENEHRGDTPGIDNGWTSVRQRFVKRIASAIRARAAMREPTP